MKMSVQRTFKIPASIALLGAMLCLSTQAQAISGASCNANTWAFANTMGGPYGTSVTQDSTSSGGLCASGPAAALNGLVSVNATTSTGPAIHNFSQSGSSSASGVASTGSLGANASGTAASTPMSYFYTDLLGNGGASDNNYQASAGGSTNAQFWDTLIINPAPGARPGDKVEFQFTLDLHGNGSVAGNGYVTVNSSLNIRQGFLGGAGGGLNLSDAGTTSVILALDAYTPFTPYEVSLSGLLDLTVNALAGRALGCSVPNIWCTTDQSQYGDYYGDSSAIGSYGSTASFYIDVLTPGASFTSESGATYRNVSVVPAPAAVWLLGSGLLGLASLVKRKKA
ncbi:MAG: PEP-CTERM sorting domain-containing protein [Gammaproteobacteria bacterium]